MRKALQGTMAKGARDTSSNATLVPLNRIRVLHFTSSRGFYGAESVILNLIENTDREKFDVYLADFVDDRDPHRELLEQVEKRGGQTFAIRCKKRIDVRSLKELLSVLKENDIDILHCHEMKSRLYGLVASRAIKLPIVTTNHLWTRESRVVRIFEYLDALYIRFCDRIIAVSDEIQHTMLRFKIPARTISVIPNGINLKQFQKRHGAAANLEDSLGIKKGTRVVGTVGRLNTQKGHKYLLEAAQRSLTEMPNICFLIVGDGPLRGELQRFAESLGIGDKVIFTGFQDDISDLYSLMDVFLLTSLKEGTPMVLLEAMAVGIPVIATDVGGVGDVVHHNENGILLRSHDSRNVSEAILRLLRNQHESVRLAANAKRTIRERYSAESMAKQYEDIYWDIAGKRAEPRLSSRQH